MHRSPDTDHYVCCVYQLPCAGRGHPMGLRVCEMSDAIQSVEWRYGFSAHRGRMQISHS
ncbi:hypothetical protein RIEGSTA812A_PEG_138 [invertebrate metagenome]|uniref:Uncharacterized protein n=1 Tax=invertebrate metagenome TaxID=1711999 RepID=A0A484H5T8_9ZZZZ